MGSTAYATLPSELIESTRPTVVEIEGDRKGIGTIGSGNIIHCEDDSFFVLTAAHVIAGCEFEMKRGHVVRKPCMWKVQQGLGKVVEHTFTATPFKIDMARDLAVLRAVPIASDLWQCIAIPIAPRAPFLYSENYAIAAPGGLMGVVSPEVITSLNFPIDDRRFYEIVGMAIPGMSGGGIFNSSGELIGIIDLVFHDSTYIAPNLGWAVRLDEIRLFLDNE